MLMKASHLDSHQRPMVTSLGQLYAVHLFPYRPQDSGRTGPGCSLLPLVVLEHIASDMATEPQLAAQQLMSHQLFDTERIEPAAASHADRDDGPSGSKRARERCDGLWLWLIR